MLEEKEGRKLGVLNFSGGVGRRGVLLPDGAGAQDKALYVQAFHQDSHAAV